jgi:hypothetical protein
MRGTWSRWLGVVGVGMTALVFSLSPTGTLAAKVGGSVTPHSTNMLDCNGHSLVYKAVKADLGGLCTDPRALYDGKPTRFLDNGSYVGHDEPSVKFISNEPGSANNITFIQKLAVDPRATPTVNSPAVSHYAQLSPAPWFGLPLCDPHSYPQNPCTPDSDANTGSGLPTDAGSTFMELQFYAPGFTPFIDAASADRTHYAAALTIDSLSCTFGFVTCNNTCIEPVNFAFLQLDGVPAGPPSPQLADVSTFTPNRQTLLMNQGDTLAVTMRDTPQGFQTRIVDLNTGRTGFMTASAGNGFMNTNIADCSGNPFSFHPEYSSAKQQNEVPWAALEGGVLMQQELGHFEPCNAVTSSFPVNTTFGDGQSFHDPSVFQVCQGGLEGKSVAGEGPCDPSTGVCVGAKTETGAACPSNNFGSGALCEFSDANCMPAGNRTTMVNGQAVVQSWPIAGCQQNVFENGDLDFEGSSYVADWPDGTAGHPSSFQYIGPFSNGLHSYPSVQYETNVGASEILCNVATGAGCTNSPVGAAFYPFWSLGHGIAGNVCVWNFGNDIAGATKLDFGKTAEYGTPDVARFAGTSISQVLPNPQFSNRC